MIAKPFGTPGKPGEVRSRPPGPTAAGPVPRRAPPPAMKKSRPAATPVASTVSSPRSPLTIGLVLASLAIFAVIRIVGAGDNDAARESIEGSISNFEGDKAPGEINYNDPVYGKAIEELRAIATGPGASAEAERLLHDLEAKQRDFAARLRENQAKMEAKLAAEDARIAEEIERQRQATGTDPEAAHRAAKMAHLTCQDEKR